MGIEDFVQQQCGQHQGAAMLPAESGWGSAGDEDGEFVDAETDQSGLLGAWLGGALVGLESRLAGGQRELVEGVSCSLRSWMGAQLAMGSERIGIMMQGIDLD